MDARETHITAAGELFLTLPERPAPTELNKLLGIANSWCFRFFHINLFL